MSAGVTEVLRRLCAGCTLVALLLTLPAGYLFASPPNILILLADDLTWTDVGAYGANHLATPNIDRLAAEGMQFTHAFTSTAMCAPTRQQLYTGLFPVRSGAYPNHGVVNQGTRSMVHALSAVGYRVGLSGKTHFGPSEAFPFEVIGHSPAADGGPDDVDLAAAEAFMTRDRSAPFALVLAFNEPHEPWTKGPRERFPPATLHVPEYLVDTPATREALSGYFAEVEHLDGQIGRVMEALERAQVADNTLVIFTSEQGAALPFAKWTLYDHGVRTAFLARWPGIVHPGSKTDALVQYVDVVPTLLEAAGEAESGGYDGRSFLPVLKGERSTHRDVVYGVHTNRGIIHGGDYPIRSVRDARFKLIWNLAPDNRYTNIRTEVVRRDAGFRSWQALAEAGDEYARQRVEAYLQRPEYELYDLQNDALEQHNLADRLEFSAVKAKLEKQLKTWMREQGDTGLGTEQDAANHMNPAIVRRIREAYGEAALPR